jgi:hypothetical protein
MFTVARVGAPTKKGNVVLIINRELKKKGTTTVKSFLFLAKETDLVEGDDASHLFADGFQIRTSEFADPATGEMKTSEWIEATK